jgi:hypothetical protein
MKVLEQRQMVPCEDVFLLVPLIPLDTSDARLLPAMALDCQSSGGHHRRYLRAGVLSI